MTDQARRPQLGRADWIRAASDALARDGVRGVAVDRLTKAVGASRGSFYWHFKSRRELLDAVLDQWEADNTTALLPELEPYTDPLERLRRLIAGVYDRAVDPIELALAAEGRDPLIAEAYARVTKRRLDALVQIFLDLGFDADTAARRAWWAYALYVGHHLLGETAPLGSRRPGDLADLADVLARR